MADFFIDLGDIAHLIRKDHSQPGAYDVPSFVPAGEASEPGRSDNLQRQGGSTSQTRGFHENQHENEADMVRIAEEG